MIVLIPPSCPIDAPRERSSARRIPPPSNAGALKSSEIDRMKLTTPTIAAAFALASLALSVPTAAAQMVVDSYSGPVTQNEIASYKTWLATQTPISKNTSDQLAHHTTAQGIDSMGLMYEVSGDTSLLATYVQWADAIFASRDDQVNGYHAVSWTGAVEPIWSVGINSDGTAVASTDGEQGLVIEHGIYCALEILRTPSIWNTTVPSGDPYGFGTTYKQRALTYLGMADYTYAHFLIKWLQTNGQWRFPAQSTGYNGSTWYGSPYPWNQQEMLNMGLYRLVDCHLILGDNPTLVSQYNTILQTALDWFLSEGCSAATYQSHSGYWWPYVSERSDHTSVEDVGHGDFDMWGYFIAYQTVRYGITDSVMTNFANNLEYAIYNGSTFNQNVDGTSSSTQTNLQMHWLAFEKYNPAMYSVIANADASYYPGTAVYFGWLMWEKNQRYQAFSVGSATGPQTTAADGSVSYTLLVAPLSGVRPTVTLTASGLPSGATASFSPASVTITNATGNTSTLKIVTSASTPVGTYTVTVSGTDGTVTHTDPVTLTVTSASSTALNDTASGIAYTGTWTYSSNRTTGDYQNDVHYTKTNGDSFSYTFVGTGIDYVTETNTDEGHVSIYLDGVLQTTVNCVTSSRLAQQKVYSASGLASGSHTLKAVKVDGTYMLLDELIVH